MNWAEILAMLERAASKAVPEGLSSIEGVLTPGRIAEMKAGLADMRLLGRRGENLATRLAETPIRGAHPAQYKAWPEGILGGAAGAGTVAAVAGGDPEEAEAAINPAEAVSATRALSRQAMEMVVANILRKARGEVPLVGDDLMNASRSVWSSIHGRPSNAKATQDLMKEYAEKMGTRALKTTGTIAPSENVFTGPKVLGHFNYERGGASTPLNYQSATHELSGHGLTSDLAQKLNIPGRVLPKDQVTAVNQMLADLFPGKNADNLRARLMGNLTATKDPMERAEGFYRTGMDASGAEFVAHAGSWQKMKELHGSVDAADAAFDKIPLVQKIEEMAAKDPELLKSWNAYKAIATTRQEGKYVQSVVTDAKRIATSRRLKQEGPIVGELTPEGDLPKATSEDRRAYLKQSADQYVAGLTPEAEAAGRARIAAARALKQGTKATIPALGVGAAMGAEDEFGFKPVEPITAPITAPVKEDFGFKPVAAKEVTEDYGFKPVSGEMTAKVGEPSDKTKEQVLGALTEEGIPLEKAGESKYGRPESISRMPSPGREWGDILTRMVKPGAAPGSERLQAMWDAANGVMNVGGNLAMTALPMREDQPTLGEAGWKILSPSANRPAPSRNMPQNENLQMAADLAGSSLPVVRGSKYLLNLVKEAKAVKAGKVAERLGIKAGGSLEQMFADTREAAAGSRFIPGIATPTPRKFSREEIEQVLAKAQEAKGGLKITDSRAFPPAVRPDMPGGPKRLKLGEVYGDLNEGWNDATSATRRAIGPEVEATARKVDDLAAISDLGQKGAPKEAKWWKAVGAKYVRSLDNWLMENGGQSVVEPIKKAVYAGDAWRSEWAHKADAILRGVKEGSKEAEVIGRYLNGDIKALGLTPELKLRGDRVRAEILEPVIAQIRADPELKGILGEIGYIKDYFPQMEKAWASRYGTENALALIHDVKPGAFKARFFKKRRGPAKDPLEDIVTVTRAYLRGSAKTLFDIKGYNSAVAAMKELPAGPGNLFEEAASKYAKTFIGQPSTRADIGSAEKALNAVHDWYYKAYIGFNPISAGLNLTQTANTFVAVGAKYTLQGMKDCFKASPEAKALAKKFTESGAMTEFRGMEISPSLEKSKGKMDEALFYLFGKAEKLNRKIAFNAGYREGIAKGFSEEKSIRHALDVVHRTQFTYGKASSVGYAGVPLVGQFSNYPLKQLEFILGSIKDPTSRKRAGAMLLISAAASPTPLGSAILEQASSLFPGIGPAGKDLLVLPGQAVYQGKLPSAYDVGRRLPFVGGALRTGKAAMDTAKWLENVGRGLAPKK